VEYIQSSWSDRTWQYINTWVLAWAINKIEVEYVYPTLKNAVNVLCWVRDTSATALSPLRINASNVIASYFINGEVSTWVTAVAWTKYKQVVTFTSWSQTISIDGVQKATSNKSITYYNTNTYYLFWFKETDTQVSSISSFKLYSFKMYNNSTLVRDFIPCYRKLDSVIWLYDLVNNQFYTNSWTGTFSKWSDVVLCELKNAYIGNWLS
jgi:hypothetical protein